MIKAQGMALPCLHSAFASRNISRRSSMLRRARTALIPLTVALIGAGVSAASAQTPIGPDQHFFGFVNGSNHDPVVYTVCPGPSSPGRLGPVANGQTFSVDEVASGGGFTGPLSSIYAWFVPPSTSTKPPSVKFSKYGVRQAIPSAIRVPCDGTGQVEFSSCPFLAPCAAGGAANYVPVRFENIAA
jgi:hypothetical protein